MAVNAATGQALNTAEQDFTVTKPPGFLAKYWWAILALIVLVIAAILAALWRRQVIRDRKNVRGLEITLRLGGEQKGRPLSAPDKKYDEVFPFVINDETTPNPWLDHPGRTVTTGTYQVRRGKPGNLRLVGPNVPNAPRPYDAELHGAPVVLNGGLELSFTDTRHPGWTSTGGGAGSSPAPAGYGATPSYSGAGTPAGGPGTGGSGTGIPGTGGYGSTASYSTYAPSSDDWTGTGGGSAGPSAPPPPPPAPGNGRADMPTMPVYPPPPPPPPTPDQKDPWL